jgi:hypothetical protein
MEDEALLSEIEERTAGDAKDSNQEKNFQHHFTSSVQCVRVMELTFYQYNAEDYGRKPVGESVPAAGGKS